MFSLSVAKGRELLPKGALLQNLQFATQDERNYIHQVVGQAQAKQSKIHVLKNDGIPYGFVALAVDKFNEVPSIFIECLFTSKPYRKLTYADLGETPLKVSQYLIGKTIEMAVDVASKVPLRYIALQLADERLETLYESHGFKRTEGECWMSQTISAR